jgi:hypothetical protein
MRRALIIAAVVAVPMIAAAAARTPILAFNRLQPGAWQLRALDGSPPRRLCIANGDEFVQLGHPGAACSRFVLTNEAGLATIHYTCAGHGYGRTTVKVETPQLVQLDSQGLIDRAPFQVAYEGRRVGECGNPSHGR